MSLNATRCQRCYREGKAGFIYDSGRVVCSSPTACDKRRLSMADKEPAYLISGRRIISVTSRKAELTVELSEDLRVKVRTSFSDSGFPEVSWSVTPKESRFS